MADAGKPSNTSSTGQTFSQDSSGTSLPTMYTETKLYPGSLKRTDKIEEYFWYHRRDQNPPGVLIDPNSGSIPNSVFDRYTTVTKIYGFENLVQDTTELPIIFYDTNTNVGNNNTSISSFTTVFNNLDAEEQKITQKRYQYNGAYFTNLHDNNPNEKKCYKGCLGDERIIGYGRLCKKDYEGGIEDFYECFYEQLTKLTKEYFKSRITKVSTITVSKVSGSSGVTLPSETIQKYGNLINSAQDSGIPFASSVLDLQTQAIQKDLEHMLEPKFTTGISLPLTTTDVPPNTELSCQNITNFKKSYKKTRDTEANRPKVTVNYEAIPKSNTINPTTKQLDISSNAGAAIGSDGFTEELSNEFSESTKAANNSISQDDQILSGLQQSLDYCSELKRLTKKNKLGIDANSAVVAKTFGVTKSGKFSVTGGGAVPNEVLDEEIRKSYEEALYKALIECSCDQCGKEEKEKEKEKEEDDSDNDPDCSNGPSSEPDAESDAVGGDFKAKNIVEIINSEVRVIQKSNNILEQFTDTHKTKTNPDLEALRTAIKNSPLTFRPSDRFTSSRLMKKSIVTANLANFRHYTQHKFGTFIFLFGRGAFKGIREIFLNEKVIYRATKDFDDDGYLIPNQTDINYGALSNIGITIPEEMRELSFTIEQRIDGRKNLPFKGSIVGYRDTGAICLRDIDIELLKLGNLITVVAITHFNHQEVTSYIDIAQSDNDFIIKIHEGIKNGDFLDNSIDNGDDNSKDFNCPNNEDKNEDDDVAEKCYVPPFYDQPIKTGNCIFVKGAPSGANTIPLPSDSGTKAIEMTPGTDASIPPIKRSYPEPIIPNNDFIRAGYNSYFYNINQYNLRNSRRFHYPIYGAFPNSNILVPYSQETFITIHDTKLVMKFSDRSIFDPDPSLPGNATTTKDRTLLIDLGVSLDARPCNTIDRTGLDNVFFQPDHYNFYNIVFNTIGVAQLTIDLGTPITNIHDLYRVHMELVTATYNNLYVQEINNGNIKPLIYGISNLTYYNAVRDLIFADFPAMFTNSGLTRADIQTKSMREIIMYLNVFNDTYYPDLVAELSGRIIASFGSPAEDIILFPTETSIRRYMYVDPTFDITAVSNVSNYNEMFEVQNPNWGTQQALYDTIAADDVNYPKFPKFNPDVYTQFYQAISGLIPANEPYLGNNTNGYWSDIELWGTELAYFLYNYNDVDQYGQGVHAAIYLVLTELFPPGQQYMDPYYLGYNSINPDCPPIREFTEGYSSDYYPYTQVEQPIPTPAQADQGVITGIDFPFKNNGNIGLFFSRFVEDSEIIGPHVETLNLPQPYQYIHTDIFLNGNDEVFKKLENVNNLGFLQTDQTSVVIYLDIITIYNNKIHHSGDIFYQDNLLYNPITTNTKFGFVYNSYTIPNPQGVQIQLYFMANVIQKKYESLILLFTNIGVIHYEPATRTMIYIDRANIISDPQSHVSNYSYVEDTMGWIGVKNGKQILYKYHVNTKVLEEKILNVTTVDIIQSQKWDDTTKKVFYNDINNQKYSIQDNIILNYNYNIDDIYNHYFSNLKSTVREAVESGVKVAIKGSYAKGDYFGPISANLDAFSQTMTEINGIFVYNNFLLPNTVQTKIIDTKDLEYSEDLTNKPKIFQLSYFNATSEKEEKTRKINNVNDDSKNLESKTLLLPSILSDDQAAAVTTRAADTQSAKDTTNLQFKTTAKYTFSYFSSVFEFNEIPGLYVPSTVSIDPYSVSSAIQAFKRPDNLMNPMALNNNNRRITDFDNYRDRSNTTITSELHVLDIPPISKEQQVLLNNKNSNKIPVIVVAELHDNYDLTKKVYYNIELLKRVTTENSYIKNIPIDQPSKVGYCVKYFTDNYNGRRKDRFCDNAYIIIKYPFTPTPDMFQNVTKDGIIYSDAVNVISVGYELIRYLNFEILTDNMVKFSGLQFGHRNTFAFSLQNAEDTLNKVDTLYQSEGTRSVHINEYRDARAKLSVIIDHTVSGVLFNKEEMQDSRALKITKMVDPSSKYEFRHNLGKIFKTPKMGYIPSAPAYVTFMDFYNKFIRSKLKETVTFDDLDPYEIDILATDTTNSVVRVFAASTTLFSDKAKTSFNIDKGYIPKRYLGRRYVMNAEEAIFDTSKLIDTNVDDIVAGVFDENGDLVQLEGKLDNYSDQVKLASHYIVQEIHPETNEPGVPTVYFNTTFFNTPTNEIDIKLNATRRYIPPIKIPEILKYYLGDYRNEIPVDSSNV